MSNPDEAEQVVQRHGEASRRVELKMRKSRSKAKFIRIMNHLIDVMCEEAPSAEFLKAGINWKMLLIGPNKP